MYFFVGSKLSGRYSARVNHQSLRQSLGTIMNFETTPWVSGTLFWKLGGFNDSDSTLFALVGFNVNEYSLALFYLVLQMSPQRPDITVLLLTYYQQQSNLSQFWNVLIILFN